jgi:protein TonB
VASGLPQASQPPAPASAPIDHSAETARWQQALGVWLKDHKLYPEEARRRGEEGRVIVRFQVARSGQVLEVALVNGSGSTRLDNATEAMLRGAHLPALPADMPADPVTVTVTIRYALSP